MKFVASIRCVYDVHNNKSNMPSACLYALEPSNTRGKATKWKANGSKAHKKWYFFDNASLFTCIRSFFLEVLWTDEALHIFCVWLFPLIESFSIEVNIEKKTVSFCLIVWVSWFRSFILLFAMKARCQIDVSIHFDRSTKLYLHECSVNIGLDYLIKPLWPASWLIRVRGQGQNMHTHTHTRTHEYTTRIKCDGRKFWMKPKKHTHETSV